MNKLHFISVEGEGFRTLIKPHRFNLDRPGLNLLKGVNGTGKTTTLEEVVWTLYGITLKDTNIGSVATWKEDRPSTWQGTRSSVVFRKNGNVYCVTRHLSYKGKTYDVTGEDHLMLAKGDDERGEKVTLLGNFRNKGETQEEIVRLMGMDAKTFMSSILFGQRMAKLVESDNGDKRKLFETLFETEWVTALKDKCDINVKKLETEIAIKSRQIQNIESTIEQKKIRLTQAQAMLQGYEENRASRILVKQGQLDEYHIAFTQAEKARKASEKALTAVKYDSQQHDKVEADYNHTKDLLQQSELSTAREEGKKKQDQSKLEYLKQDIARAVAELDKEKAVKVEGECPYCAQELKEGNKLDLTHQNKLATCKDKVKATKTAYEAFEKECAKYAYSTQVEISAGQLKKTVEDLNKQLHELSQLEQQYNDLWDHIEKQKASELQYKKDILRTNNEIDAIKAEQPPKLDVKAIENEIETDKTDLSVQGEALLDLQRELEIASWWSTKAFSSSGIKAYIFTSMLSQLNQNTKKYGNKLGVSLEFSIDLSKASKPFTTRCSIGNKTDRDYRDASGGEKQKLDIVLLFAMHDLVNFQADINILIMDEIFEGLSEDNETAVFELIRDKANEGKSIYVITHSAVIDSLYANTILFEKDSSGNTRIID